jgi:hypothetical protein
LERSTDQVIKPINIEALSKWVGKIPSDIVKDMHNIAPMLSVLGYDPLANPPDYGKPDIFVIDKMQNIERNKDEWNAKEQEMMKIRESIRNSLIKHNSNGNNGNNNDFADTPQQNGDSDKLKTVEQSENVK